MSASAGCASLATCVCVCVGGGGSVELTVRGVGEADITCAASARRSTVPALHSTPCEGHRPTPKLSACCIGSKLQQVVAWCEPALVRSVNSLFCQLGRQSQPAMTLAWVGTGIRLHSNRRTKRCPSALLPAGARLEGYEQEC